ncbi:helix-turn-helix transcriptional regulator [Bradyrhizobium ganzhouense]|uniref:helix-turn-helix transcriptional regulator n=1 Tax=Bradyrhizobium ganzhouense TaxID=1179767 RepID=UPI003CE6DCC8
MRTDLQAFDGQDSRGRALFAVQPGGNSHALSFERTRFDYYTREEAGGQLVVCTTGEIELFGHAGQWVIPESHMVYIPQGRQFAVRARRPASGRVLKFCHAEVSWHHEGCWVGPVNMFADAVIEHGMKWGVAQAGHRRAKSYFVTIGDMLPEWFRQERILWTPYAHTTAMQRAIEFARSRGPGVALSTVARHAGMSERTLRRHMQAELGQTWRDFICELRMNRAMDMLRKKRKSVTEIAFEVGFSSSSAFSSAFLSYVGKTPSTYAKSFR